MCDPHPADAAQQNQNQRVNGLPVAAEDHFAHFAGLRGACGEWAAGLRRGATFDLFWKANIITVMCFLCRHNSIHCWRRLRFKPKLRFGKLLTRPSSNADRPCTKTCLHNSIRWGHLFISIFLLFFLVACTPCASPTHPCVTSLHSSPSESRPFWTVEGIKRCRCPPQALIMRETLSACRLTECIFRKAEGCTHLCKQLLLYCVRTLLSSFSPALEADCVKCWLLWRSLTWALYLVLKNIHYITVLVCVL